MKRAVALIGVILLAACSSMAGETPRATLEPDAVLDDRMLAGTVVDASSGEPLGGVGIRVGGTTVVVTDSEGRFRVVLPAPGTVEVRASLSGYLPAVFTVDVPASGGVRAEIALESSLVGT